MGLSDRSIYTAPLYQYQQKSLSANSQPNILCPENIGFIAVLNTQEQATSITLETISLRQIIREINTKNQR
jgi:hypothetical protein